VFKDIKRLLFRIPICIGLIVMLGVTVLAVSDENQFYVHHINQRPVELLRQVEIEDEFDYTIDMDLYPNYQMVAQNDGFVLYLDQHTHNIAVRVKESDYVWFSSDPDYDGIDSVTGRDHNSQTQNRIRSSIYYRTTQFETISSDRHILNENHEVVYDFYDDGIHMNVSLLASRISFQVVVKLTEKGFHYYVPFSSIVEGDIRLQSIRLFPNFGSTTGDNMNGYMFIPDGSGALIRFNTEVTGVGYTAPIYGTDFGYATLNLERQAELGVLPPLAVKIPVIGMVHGINQNGFIAHVSEGESYGQIRAEVKNNVTKYFSNSFNFLYRQIYFRPTNNTGSGFRISSPQMSPFDVKVDYIFLSDEEANYVGMAKAYRDIVTSKLRITTPNERSHIPLGLTFIGDEITQGIIRKNRVSMTKYENALQIIQSLEQENIDQMVLTYTGKTTSGDYQFEASRSLGGKNDFNTLKDYLEQQSYPLFFENEYNYRFSSDRNIAKQVGGPILELLSNSDIFTHHYLLASESIHLRHQQIEKGLNQYDIGLSLRHSTTLAYTHINSARVLIHRHEMMDMMLENLAIIASEHLIKMSDPNAIFYPYAYALNDVTMATSGYTYVTDGVPFIQIALSGLIDMFAQPLNFVANRDIYLLKMIEYGQFPAYVLTYEDAFLLKESDDMTTYTAQFERWKSSIVQEYHMINNALKHVQGMQIVDHTYHGDGLVEVVYEHGVRILVNYGMTNRIFEGRIIEALSYDVLGV
jgi:hypothetical protein